MSSLCGMPQRSSSFGIAAEWLRLRAAGQLPTFAAWVAVCKDSGEGTTTLHDLFAVMLAAVPSERQGVEVRGAHSRAQGVGLMLAMQTALIWEHVG